ncbi:MAG: S8 family serine peptidase [Bacteroidales bacterium]
MLMFAASGRAHAQQVSSKYMVTFTDKAGTPYQVTNPQAFLSNRAIERRTKFGIPVTQLDLPVAPAYLDTLAQRGLKVDAASKWFNAALVDSKDSLAMMDLLNLPFVEAVDLVYYVVAGSKGQKTSKTGKSAAMSADYTPFLEDGQLWDNASKSGSINYGGAFAQANMIGANYMHQIGYTGDSVIIAVLDAGYSMADMLPAFDSLRLQNRILSTRNFVRPTESVYTSSQHGTMVLSTMTANLPGQIVGTAPHASFHLLLSEDVLSEFPVEEFYWGLAAEYADSIGADMINSSLGYTTFDLPLLSHTYQDMDGKTNLSSRAATIAASRGMLVIASAGNGGGSSWFYISSPGDADSIVTVGAVDVAGIYAPFSSTGPSFDQRVKPDVVAVGLGSTIAASWGGATTGNGTSFSGPIMCGALACLWQANPNMSNMQIIDALHRSAHQYNFPDTLLGYGIPNLAIAHLILGGQDFHDITGEKLVTVAPNPFNNLLMITFYAADTHQVLLELYDLRGKLYHSRSYLKTNGFNVIPLTDLDNLAAGVYVLKITDGKNVITQKVIRR